MGDQHIGAVRGKGIIVDYDAIPDLKRRKIGRDVERADAYRYAVGNDRRFNLRTAKRIIADFAQFGGERRQFCDRRIKESIIADFG